MRTLILGLLAATALSSAAFTASANSSTPFGTASAPLTAEEKSAIKEEGAKIRKARAAAAERARQKAAARRAAKEVKSTHETIEPAKVETTEPTTSLSPVSEEMPMSIPATPEASAPEPHAAAPSPAIAPAAMPAAAPAPAMPAPAAAGTPPALPVATPAAPATPAVPAGH